MTCGFLNPNATVHCTWYMTANNAYLKHRISVLIHCTSNHDEHIHTNSTCTTDFATAWTTFCTTFCTTVCTSTVQITEHTSKMQANMTSNATTSSWTSYGTTCTQLSQYTFHTDFHHQPYFRSFCTGHPTDRTFADQQQHPNTSNTSNTFIPSQRPYSYALFAVYSTQ